MQVAAILKRKGDAVVSADAGSSVRSAAALLTEYRIGAVLVRGPDGTIHGILSERDIVRGIALEGERVLDLPVEALMTRDVLTCRPDTSVAELMRTMTEKRLRHLPVLEDGQLVGMISIGDVVKVRVEEAEMEVEMLQGYIAGSH
ncbi:CBS domain-containing protein [Arenibaculum pallidiluteum]|uniref:CBS domain-containing protein n=1 Tax=Arenibaculum pallidiluteum TaxID=2812559 RepID=UPI001A956A3E|nr:CBS domain-containing protein [Arenibaculum pallidiluteum]